MKNSVTLDDLSSLPIGEIASLGSEQLFHLINEADARTDALKKAKDKLTSALDFRYGELASKSRQAAGKDNGVVRFDDGAFTVVADLPKRPKWDQSKLQQVVQTIESWGSNPKEFVSLEIKVSETKFNAWPTEIRKVFEDARTVENGKPSFELIMKEAAE